MKILDPTSGLRQITSGYLCTQRKFFLDLVVNGTLKPVEIGYYQIFVISADWDADIYRNGLIRHELTKLSQIWQIPYPTLFGQLKNLVAKGLISVEEISQQRVYRIVDFDSFTVRRAQVDSKRKMTAEELKLYFPKLLAGFEIQEPNQIEQKPSFSSSSNSYSSVHRVDSGLTEDEIRDIEESIGNLSQNENDRRVQ